MSRTVVHNSPVLLDKKGPIGVVRLNRPHRRNAINQALLTTLYDHLESLNADPAIRSIVLTGTDPSFCSGIDLEALTTENLFDPRGDGSDLPDIMAAMGKPVIAAVNGHAITGGFEIALNCDFIIASKRAVFKDTHVRVGIHPGWGMTQLLQEAVGGRRARQMSFTGMALSAETARDWGLVNEVVSHDQLMPRTCDVAGAIGEADPGILRAMRELIADRHRHSLSDARSRERDGFRKFAAAFGRNPS